MGVLSHEARLRLLARSGLSIGAVRLRVRAGSLDVGVDGGKRSKSLQGGAALEILLLEPLAPALQPGVVVLALVEVDVQIPRNRVQPLVLEGVQFRDGNTADLGPRSILEGVVVQELTPQEEADGQHSPHFTVGRLEATRGVEHVDSTREVVHSEEDGGGGEPGRREES